MTEPKAWVTDNALYVTEYKMEINQQYRAASADTNGSEPICENRRTAIYLANKLSMSDRFLSHLLPSNKLSSPRSKPSKSWSQPTAN